MDMDEDFGNNRIEDVSWLCSLSESELDLLICLKKLVLQRARIIGHDDLAKKVDLKMLRAIGFVSMEYLKGGLKDLSFIPGLAESAAFLDGCNLLNCNPNANISIEELKACINIDSRIVPKKKNIDSRKRKAERQCEEAVPKQKKQKSDIRRCKEAVPNQKQQKSKNGRSKKPI